jgi:DNA-binding MarR family transcriptional regulator
MSHAIAARIGLHATDMECLDLLQLRGAMTAGQLARLAGLSTGAVTRLVDRLAVRGLVRRREDPADRRKVVVEPVAEAVEALCGPLYRELQAQGQASGAQFSLEEMEVAVRFLANANQMLRSHIARIRAGIEGEAPTGSAPAGVGRVHGPPGR